MTFVTPVPEGPATVAQRFTVGVVVVRGESRRDG
jgi:hypothetical protein